MAFIVPEISLYPDAFPLPSKAPYGASIDTGLARTQYGYFPDQGKAYESNPTTVQLQFSMPLALFHEWEAWMNAYAVTRWIVLSVVDQYAGFVHTSPLSSTVVRMGSKFSIRPQGFNRVNVSCAMEVYPQGIGNAQAGVGSGIHNRTLWIIGGTPVSPSVDTVTAGSPPVPAVDTYIAGPPASHRP